MDDAASQGSGDPVDVAGEAVLQVTLTGVGYPYDTGVEEFAGARSAVGPGHRTVTEVVLDATFEGTSVGLHRDDGPRPRSACTCSRARRGSSSRSPTGRDAAASAQ